MYTVVYVRVSKGIYTVGISKEGECEAFSLSETEYTSVGAPVKGVTIDDDTACEIRRMDEYRRALKRALTLLCNTDKNRRGMLLRLRECGFSGEAAEFAVEECLRLGYIDERRQLFRIISKEANISLHGDKYIRAKLSSAGYSLTDINEVMSELLSSGEIDFSASFSKLCEKKGVTQTKEKFALAYKRGFGLMYAETD